MPSDDFTTKEMLLQLMTRVESINIGMQEQRVLLERHMQASVSRDDTIKELKVEVKTMKADVENLKSLATKAATVWAIAVTVIGFALNRIF